MVEIEQRTEERYQLKTRVAITTEDHGDVPPCVFFNRDVGSRGVYIVLDGPVCFDNDQLLPLEIDLIKATPEGEPIKFITKDRVIRTEDAGLAIRFAERAKLVSK